MEQNLNRCPTIINFTLSIFEKILGNREPRLVWNSLEIGQYRLRRLVSSRSSHVSTHLEVAVNLQLRIDAVCVKAKNEFGNNICEM